MSTHAIANDVEDAVAYLESIQLPVLHAKPPFPTLFRLGKNLQASLKLVDLSPTRIELLLQLG